jgi:hypothetical protein
MMLMLLLTELTRLDVQLSTEQDGLKVDAPVGSLTDDLHKAMMEHKAALLRYAVCPYVETIDGLGMLTGHRQEFGIIDFVAPERQERLRYTLGVRLLHDGLERFYLPGTLSIAEQRKGE